MYIYRDYQQDLHDRVFAAWGNKIRDVLVRSDVGTGKTVLISNITREMQESDPNKYTVIIAHRQELVSQISLSCAENGLSHRVIAGKTTIRFINKRHVKRYKRSFIKQDAKVIVASVGTLIKNTDIPPEDIQLWIVDEAHHVLSYNSWGKCVKRYVNAKGLGVTATPLRADGKGLGSDSDGVFDELIENTKTMGQLILEGTLTPFKIYAPPGNIDLREVNITKSGDFSKKPLSKATLNSSIVGDVVKHYKDLAIGKLGVTFVPDVEIGELIAQQYNDNEVPAALIHAKTPDSERARLLDLFEERKILNLVNVDIFGEGFNLPAIEVVSFARATASYGLYVQQFGRALRILEGKTHAIIIDHVGNVVRHGLPTQHREWTLDRREVRAKSDYDPDKMKLVSCKNPICMGVYEAFHPACPYCGLDPKNLPRAKGNDIDMVDGDLVLMDFSYIDETHKEIARINRELGPKDFPRGAAPVVVASIKKKHAARKEAQAELRESIAWWSTRHESLGDVRARQKLFYLTFGLDVLKAQTLGARDALELKERVENHEQRLN